MIIHNEDVKELAAEIPEGHRHLRTTIMLRDGKEFVLQEATVASLVRAYIVVKTHPQKIRMRLTGKALAARKGGYAEWQLVESECDKMVEGAHP